MTDIIGGGAPQTFVKDATIETFQADVMDASMNVPVVVDFWASWCGPCKTLGPMLEKAINAHGGKVLMVKVDTDKNQMLAQQLRIQSLPTVMGFVGGQPVDGFAGAIPESEINGFIDRLLQTATQMGLSGAGATGPDAETLIAAGDEAFGAGDVAAAHGAYAQAVEAAEDGSDPHAIALAGMARCHGASGNREQAEQMLAMIPDAKRSLPAVAQVSAMLALAGNGDDAPAAATIGDEVPTDAAGFLQLGLSKIDAGDMTGAMDALLNSIELDRELDDSAARTKLLTVFDALGAAHPDVKTARRRLSSILFA